KAVALVEKEREYLRRGLQKIAGLRVFPSRANFLLAEGRLAGVSGAELVAALAKRGLLIRDAGNFKGLDEFYFRLAVRRRAENRRLLKALKEVFMEKRG
ncbi:MAG: threonine-phosphate decarboxylase, partial [Moorella sp. (in: Bacteria)]|nr:threonine-phosphate decarboxylase [Moorella sp. (in: firmicutes)]